MPEEGACAAAVKRTRGETKGAREACTKQGRNGSDAGTDCVGQRGIQEWAPFANTVVCWVLTARGAVQAKRRGAQSLHTSTSFRFTRA